ncbi:MotA/TolQ/ExbB proton channel family protein [Virgibacillus sp. Bac332]|uniref:MotA/TolQ/ExbB proton channel family protein n=1 Tax=Virgibacillus sp. Bac332 TaxID=2419842 RepID=UPI000EF47550|nr:MotA/TolQ/ExbB proton channel family protein [Virgibacillus sp. Bac332]
MIESILKLFTSEQKAEAILANPMIELIFIVLFVTFMVALLVHLALFNKLKKIRDFLKDTSQMEIEPLVSFKQQYDKKQQGEAVKAETFVQEKFSSWRLFNVPVVSLIKIIQMTVSMFILIGVLGTFIGLTSSLSSINIEGSDLVEGVAGVLAGIDVAFYTSIAGMGFSLVMTVLIKVLNTEFMLTDIMLMTESKLEENEQHGISQLIQVSETINESILSLQATNQESLQGIVAAFTGFQEYTTGLQQSAKNLASFNDGLSENLRHFQQLFDYMKDVTDGFSEGTKNLNENFEALFTYFKRIDGRNERMLKAFENTYEKVKEVSRAQLDTLQQFDKSVGDMKQFTSDLLEEQSSLHTIFESINGKSKDLVERMASHNKEFKQVFGEDLSTKLTGIMTQLRELSTGFDKMGHSIVKLPEALDVINQTQAEYKHLLSDRFTELKEFNQTFNQHLKTHLADSMNFEKHMQEASSTYEQLGMKNNQLIHEMNTTISQMNQAFQQRENQLETSVGVLKDTLSTYVTNLEGSLGSKLDKVGQSIRDYMQGANDGIRKEFQDLRRTSEANEQSHARLIQQTLQDLNREIQILNQQLTAFVQRTTTPNNPIRLSQNEY